MKALLLKDWYVLRKQAWAYLIIVLVWGAIPSEVLNLLAVVYGAMIPYTAMAYDQRSRWDRFARMLPYSDRTVVLSRYALGWVSLLIGTAAVTLCQGIVSCLPVRIEAAAGLSRAVCGNDPAEHQRPPHAALRLRKGPDGLRPHHIPCLCFRGFSQRSGRRKSCRGGSFPGTAASGGAGHHRHRRLHPAVPEILSGKPLKKRRPAMPDGAFIHDPFSPA